jgi:hypothetical protein
MALALTMAGPAAAAPAAPNGGGLCDHGTVYVGVCATSPGKQKQEPRKAAKKEKKPSFSTCKVTRLAKQPPAGSSLREGHPPGEGAFYTRRCAWNAAGAALAGWQAGANVFWAANPPKGTANPAVVAQKAIDKMALRGPRITMSPKPDGEGVLGMPVWMAVDEASKDRFGPNTASASAGGVTVEATARVNRVVWEMGDGTTRTCTPTQMKPYKKSYGLASSPCGHRYRALPENAKDGRGTYEVAATAHWQVEWEVQGGGESGVLNESRTSDIDVNIGEAQVVN